MNEYPFREVRAGNILQRHRSELMFRLLLPWLIFFSCIQYSALAAHPLSSIPPDTPDQAWLEKAMQISREFKQRPETTVTRCDVTPTQMLIDFSVREPWKTDYARFALAAPAGEITSASLVKTIIRDQSNEEITTAGHHLPLSAAHLGYVRSHRLISVSLQLNVVGLPDQRIAGGTILIQLRDPTSSPGVPVKAGPLRDILQRFVANPQQLDSLAIVPPKSSGIQELDWVPAVTSELTNGLPIRIPVTEDGLYQIKGSDLVSSGVTISALRPDLIRLLVDETETPLHYIPADLATGYVSPNDRFIFYGRENRSPHTHRNCYWLVYDGKTPGIRMASIDPAEASESQSGATFPASVTVEKDTQVLTKNDQFLTILGYRWVWKELTTSSPLSFNFDVPGMAPIAQQLKAKIRIYFNSWSTEHRQAIRININGSPVGDFPMESQMTDEFDFELPGTLLKERGNSAQVELVDTTSSTLTAVAGRRPTRIHVYFDNLEIKYPRLYMASGYSLDFKSPASDLNSDSVSTAVRNISYSIGGLRCENAYLAFDTTTVPVRLASLTVAPSPNQPGKCVARFSARESGGRQYHLVELDKIAPAMLEPTQVQADLRSTQQKADYIIIAHNEFLQACEPFAAEKRKLGHEVLLVDVQHVYDQFDAGQQTPRAIKSFLRYAAHNWTPSPNAVPATYVLLVGDATSAYRDEFRNDVINYVPSCSVPSSPGALDSFASDIWYTTFDGEDHLADAFTGRLSVNNVRDLETILAKQSEYASQPADSEWQNILSYVADHTDFEAAVTNVAGKSVPDSFFLKGIFMADEPWIDNYYFPLEVADAKKAKVSPSTTRKILDMFNAGSLMVTYFGHGSPNVWSNERIWFGGDSENSDNHMLTNRDKLAFIVNMTCNSGAIDYPMPKWNVCISEDFMRIPNGGAIACYVPSGPGVTQQHEQFTLQLNKAILEDRVNPLGAALVLADWQYLLKGNPHDLVRMFILLGDPALQLKLPQKGGIILPDYSQSPVSLKLPSELSDGAGRIDMTSLNGKSISSRTAPLTTGTTAYPLSEFSSETLRISAFVSSNSAGVASGVRIAPSSGLTIVSSQIVQKNPLHPGDHVDVKVVLENSGPLPKRDCSASLLNENGEVIGTSSVQSLLPGEQTTVLFTFDAPSGLMRYRFSTKSGGANYSETFVPSDLETVAVADHTTGSQQAVQIDQRSLSLTHARAGASVLARVSGKLYNLSGGEIRDLELALADSRGNVIPDSVTRLSQIGGGLSAPFELSREIPADTNEITFKVVVDPNKKLNIQNVKPVEARFGQTAMADVAIPENGIRVVNPAPSDGETVFFDVDVVNHGMAICNSIRVEALESTTSQAKTLESRTPRFSIKPFSLDPGASTTVRVRWDPFRNAGDHELLFRAVAGGDIAEISYSNNAQVFPIHILSKYKLKPVSINATVTPEDRVAKQVRFIARIDNLGESPAQGVKVTFYADRNKEDPNNLLGSVIVKEVPGLSSSEATLIYKLKPGEERRRFRPAFEASLKGSLQRVTLE